MGIAVAVIGASGYAGGELLRLLARHPELSVTTLVANRAAGRRLGSVHPHLHHLADHPVVSMDDADLGSVEVAFLALPHGQSARAAARFADGVRIVDLGADFRLADPAAWERFYGGSHPGTWTYGLPELPGARPAIAAAARVASPGCYATAITLGFAPLLAASLIGQHGDSPPVLSAVAASGVSGAGRSPAEHLLGAEVMGDLSVYRVGGAHRHIPEIEQALAAVGPVAPKLSFTPVLAPMPRGILAVCTADGAAGTTDGQVRAALAEAYAAEPFVRVLPEGRWPRTASVSGSNAAEVQGTVEPETGRTVVVVALDNLGKGAAGQAIQNANLMLGLDETLGLPVDGVAP